MLSLLERSRAGHATFIICLFALLALVTDPFPAAQGAPFPNDVRVLVQPGGAKIKARQWGDEWMHGWETTAGLTILRDGATGNWVYAVRGMSGGLEPSGKVVGRDQPPEGVLPHLRPRMSANSPRRFTLSAKAATAARTGQLGESPSQGTNNLLPILVNFSDTKPTFAAKDFDTLMFGRGNKSLADYYQEVSFGKLRLQAGPAGIVGWYTIPMTKEVALKDYHAMVQQALSAADRAGVNFAPYDNDGDCDADGVIIIRQGEAGEGPIWFSGLPSYMTRSPCAKGGFIRVDSYVSLAEKDGDRLTGMGLFAHEYGHAIGLPDLYDYGDSSQGTGDWSAMSGGTYETPGLLDAWSRYVLGWLDPIRIEKGAAPINVTLQPASESPKVLLFGSGEPNSEYFLVENRQWSRFEWALQSSGLLVWHVDEEKRTNEEECEPRLPGECATRHYKLALVQADGRWDLENNRNGADADDPFPGGKGVTSFTDDTVPSARLYSGARSGIRITSIRESGRNVTALISQDFNASLRYTKQGSGEGKIAASPSGTPVSCALDTCLVQYDSPVNVTLTATPAPGSSFKGWSGAGCSGTGTCTVKMSADQQVTANFEQPERVKLYWTEGGEGKGRIVNSPAGFNETCNNESLCEAEYVKGAIVTLKAEPAVGSAFASWEQYVANGSDWQQEPVCSETDTCTVTMLSSRFVGAWFEKLSSSLVSLVLQTAGTGAGNIARSPFGSEKGCSTATGACEFQYNEGTVVTLTARPAAGSVFAGWSGASCSGTGTCTVTMSAAANVVAAFNKLPVHVLSYVPSGTGTGSVVFTPAGSLGSCGAACSSSFAAGTLVTVTATAAPGSTFSGWSGRTGCSGTGTCVLTMTKAMTLKAKFTKLPTYALTYSKTGRGSGTVAFSPDGQNAVCASQCVNRYLSGTRVTLTASSQPGSVFLGWSGNRSCSGTGPCTLTLSRSQSVKANFAPARTSSLPN